MINLYDLSTQNHDDLKTLAEYCADSKESDDFHNQLLEGDIEPDTYLSDGMKIHIESKIDEYREAYENGADYKELENKLEYLALHTQGHIYCSASRILNKR